MIGRPWYLRPMSEEVKDPSYSASRFKTHCLSIIDEVAETGVPVVVTKRGVPRVRVLPLEEDTAPSLVGSVRYADEEDLLAPVDASWNAESG